METWDEMGYGPLEICVATDRTVKFGEIKLRLGRTEFIILLRLMACRGGAVSRAALAFGLTSDYVVRLTVFLLRKRLRKHFGDLVVIQALKQYGYKLSLSGEFLFKVIPYGGFDRG